ncbi:hypothetical protein [Streptomyces sp. SBT349]|uniref:hypothetical protein n=1 Tax=Streptomyces sp. SBT349 TaxID=1580539 RepID=UPI00066D30F1|nr:hypothetical protein [Streptomyces sp. SBT349]
MRIPALLSASALAATIVLGGAGTALAGGSASAEELEIEAEGKKAACGTFAAVIRGNPVFAQGCKASAFEFELDWKKWTKD